MKHKYLKCADPLSSETADALKKVRHQAREMLRQCGEAGLLESLQAYIIGLTDCPEEDPDYGPSITIGALANYAMASLLVEMAKDVQAELN